MTTKLRRNDWRLRLLDWATETVGASYQWGVTDCGSLAVQALSIMFDDDETLPKWSSAKEALKVLHERGTVGEQMLALGAEKMPLAFMRAGDIVVSTEEDESVGRVGIMICIDCRQCLASTTEGVVWSEPPADAEIYSLWALRSDHGSRR